jgi:hypothetical protein
MKIFDGTALLDISRDNQGYRSRRNDCWYGYTDGDLWGALPFVSALYRGQSKRYLPMLPSIARGLNTIAGRLSEYAVADQAKIVLRLAQSWWFARELDHHPVSTHAANQNIKLDRIALAQHYGIPTGYLDLTDDFDVGAFFATCRYTGESWEPIETGIGVVYRVELSKGFYTPFGKCEPLGPQVLPRPTEQCAWVTELPLVHSFDGWPNVEIMQFRQDTSVGVYFLEKFGGGEDLFPRDPLKDIADEIVNCGCIPNELIERAIDSFSKDPNGISLDHAPLIQSEVSRIVELIDYCRLLTDELVASLMADFQRRSELLADIKARWRMVRSEPRASSKNDAS